MRRRLHWGQSLDAEGLVALQARLASQFRSIPSDRLRSRLINEGLRAHGFGPVEVIRARIWLRRGRPVDYRWDER